MRDSSSLWLGPPNSTSPPWCTTRSTMAVASLSSAKTVPHLPNSTLAVNTTLLLVAVRYDPVQEASPRPRRRARSRTRPGPGASPWPRRRAAGRAPPPAWPCRAAAPAARSAGTSRGGPPRSRRSRGRWPCGSCRAPSGRRRPGPPRRARTPARASLGGHAVRCPISIITKKGSLKSTGSLCLQANVCPKRGDLRSEPPWRP